MPENIKIVPFTPLLAGHFKDLNLFWLEQYFRVEEKDVELLEDCQKNIIDKGGYIFFAEFEDDIIGCFSLIRLSEKCYELGKMAVKNEYQGLKIGQKLMIFAIDFAKKNNWKQIVLYSSTKLGPALHIYRKYGFLEVALESGSPYARSDIKMELNL